MVLHHALPKTFHRVIRTFFLRQLPELHFRHAALRCAASEARIRSHSVLQ